MDDIRAGDTLSLETTYTDYPASTYASTLVLVNASERYNIAGVADEDTHTFTAPATSTGLWESGTYNYFVQVTKSGDVYTAESGTVKILPSYDAVIDLRSDAKKNLDALKAVYYGRATKSDLSYTIAGRSILKLTPAQLRAEITYWEGKYNEELRQERIDNGESLSTNVFIKFVDN